MNNTAHHQLLKKALDLGYQCYRSGQLDEASLIFKKALSIAPSSFDAHHFLGIICIQKGMYVDAIPHLVSAIKCNTQSGDAFQNLAFALFALKRYDAALENFEIAVSIKPELASAYRGMGDIFSERGDINKAIRNYELSIQYDKGSLKAFNNLGHAYKSISELSRAIECFKKAYALDPNRLDIYSNILMCMAFSANEVDLFISEARKYGVAAAKRAKKFQDWPGISFVESKKLRIGFVSADYRQHVVTKLFEGPLKELSSYDIELIAYHNNWTEDDALTERMKGYFSEWSDVFKLTDKQLAEKIHSERIDILVDMSGHSAHNRLPVFAYKAAPIQISWMGFFASTGLEEIDYFITDKTGSPDRNNGAFTEEIWQFKSTQCLAMIGTERLSRVDYSPFLDNDHFTFGCMNRVDKASDEVLNLWSEILAKVGGAKLYLDSKLFRDSSFKADFINRTTKFGIDPERLILASHDGSYRGYLNSFKNFDLALDTFPYNGSTVNMESLWMGVPYISLLGNSVISRTGAALLTGVKMEELIAKSKEEYINLAVDFAFSPDKLLSLKAQLSKNIDSSGFFNPNIMAEQLFSDFNKMWSIHLKKQGD